MLMLLGPILMINVLLDIGDCFHIRELRHNLCAFVLLQTWVIGMSFRRHFKLEIKSLSNTRWALIPRNNSRGFHEIDLCVFTEFLHQTLMSAFFIKTNYPDQSAAGLYLLTLIIVSSLGVTQY